MTALMPADVEALAVGYLDSVMDATVGTRVTTTTNMVRVEALGGTRRQHVIDELLLVIQCWHPKSPEAYQLCRAAVALMLDLPEDAAHGRLVRHVEVFGMPSNFPDPDTDNARYQATVQINVRPT